MDIHSVHSVATMFPPMEQGDYEALKADIAARGLLEPIWTHGGAIVDGRHRYKACVELGITPRTQEWNGNGSLVEFVVALNLRRRHLSASQKAVVALEIEAALAVEAKERKERLGREAKLRYWHGDNEEAKVLPNLVKPLDDEPLHAGKQAAQIVGVASGYIAEAKRLQRDNPELLDKVRSGELTLQDAKREIKREAIDRKVEAYQEKRSMPASVEVVHADMLTFNPPRRYALIVADPPYNVTGWQWDDLGTDNDFIGISEQWIAHCLTLAADTFNLFWFCSPRYMADIELLFRKLNAPIQSRIIWHRRNMALGSDAKFKFIDSWECIFHIGNKPLNFNPVWNEERFDVQTFAAPQTNFHDRKVHPTQKPLDLIRLLVRVGSQVDDFVLDPFAGGGTTGEACLSEGRMCTLVERDGDYVHAIQERLSK